VTAGSDRLRPLSLLALVFLLAALGAPAWGQDASRRRQLERWSRLLYSDDLQRRASAAAALLATDAPEALDALRKSLRPEAPEPTRVTVIQAFEFHGKDGAIDLIIAALDDKSERVRQAAAAALRAIKTPHAIAELRRTAEDPKASVMRRTQAIGILGDMREWEAVPTLIALLGDADESVARSARAALKLITLLDFETRLEWLDWWEIYRKKTRVQALEERVKRQDEQIKKLNQIVERLYLRLLQEHENDKDPALLMDALAEGGSDKVKLYAIERLSVFQSPKPEMETLITKALARALQDPGATVRKRAAESVGARKAVAALPALVESLADPVPFVREAAARALGQLHSADAVEPLCKTLSDESPDVAATAASALGQIADPRALGPLVAIINRADADDTSPLYEAAAQAIAGIAAPEALPVLTGKLIVSKNVKVRYAGARALGRYRTPDVVAPLARLSRGDPQPEIRVAAVTALAETGQDAAIAPLVAALADKEKTVADQAFRSLLELSNGKPERFANTLQQLMEQRRFDLAEKALERAGDRLRALPDYAKRIAGLRYDVARGLMAAGEWERAKTHLDKLVSEDTKNSDYLKALTECLKQLGKYEALAELLTLARRDVPGERSFWWRASADLAETIFKSGEWRKVVDYVDQLEKEDKSLGGPEIAPRLREIRKQAAERLPKARGQESRTEPVAAGDKAP